MQYLYRLLEPDPDSVGDYRWHKVAYRDWSEADKEARRVSGIVVTPNEVAAAVLLLRQRNHDVLSSNRRRTR